MYAIVRTGGKQYRVEEGRTLEVERLPGGEGDTVELADVLMIGDDGNVTVGTPLVEGARVLASVESHGRGPKIVVFKYKNKTRRRKKTGHRQGYTRLAIEQIVRPGDEVRAAKPKRKATATKVEDDDTAGPAVATADIAEPVAAEPEPVTAEAEAPAPRARRPRVAAEKKAATAAKPKTESKAKAEKPAAKAPKAKADADKPKAKRRLPIGRKKETE